jgi:flavin reductase (DIM6/NTAB) family NADH-FMN oxidoreductase RutF
MHPKQILVAIYNDTKTLEIVDNSPKFVLQLLAAQQYRMVDLLGKKSGNNIERM